MSLCADQSITFAYPAPAQPRGPSPVLGAAAAAGLNSARLRTVSPIVDTDHGSYLDSCVIVILGFDAQTTERGPYTDLTVFLPVPDSGCGCSRVSIDACLLSRSMFPNVACRCSLFQQSLRY